MKLYHQYRVRRISYKGYSVVEVLEGPSVLEVAWMPCTDLDVGSEFICVCISLSETRDSITLPMMSPIRKIANGIAPVYWRCVSDTQPDSLYELLNSSHQPLSVYFQNWPRNGGTIYASIDRPPALSLALSGAKLARSGYFAKLPTPAYNVKLIPYNGPGIISYYLSEINATLAVTEVYWYSKIYFTFGITYLIDPLAGNNLTVAGEAILAGYIQGGLISMYGCQAAGPEIAYPVPQCSGPNITGPDIYFDTGTLYSSEYVYAATPNQIDLPLGGGTINQDIVVGFMPSASSSTVRFSRTFDAGGRMTAFNVTVLTNPNSNTMTIDNQCMIIIPPNDVI